MHALLDDPWIASQIEAALAPYVGRLPAAELAWMREQLAETLATDESAAALLRRAHPRAVEQSGDIAFDDEAEGAAPATAARDASAPGRGRPR